MVPASIEDEGTSTLSCLFVHNPQLIFDIRIEINREGYTLFLLDI